MTTKQLLLLVTIVLVGIIAVIAMFSGEDEINVVETRRMNVSEIQLGNWLRGMESFRDFLRKEPVKWHADSMVELAHRFRERRGFTTPYATASGMDPEEFVSVFGELALARQMVEAEDRRWEAFEAGEGSNPERRPVRPVDIRLPDNARVPERVQEAVQNINEMELSTTPSEQAETAHNMELYMEYREQIEELIDPILVQVASPKAPADDENPDE
jgi:hypothetical protein